MFPKIRRIANERAEAEIERIKEEEANKRKIQMKKHAVRMCSFSFLYCKYFNIKKLNTLLKIYYFILTKTFAWSILLTEKASSR